MDEEVGVRMTRLRRRLSVEQNEDVSSPATPTKKRGSKLPKPALENIAENMAVSSPKRTTRRSMATEAVGDDAGTPSKKVTRGKANSSLLSESISAESPRAARVTRRSSLAGVEAETQAVPTPVRRSRRISKEYKSPENQADNLTKKNKKVNTTIKEIEEENVEEIDKSFPSTIASKDNNDFLQVSGDSGHSDKSSPSSIRKSPRLSLKKNMSTVEEDTEDKDNINLKQDSPEKKNIVSEATESVSVNISRNRKGNKKRSKSFTILEKENNDSRVYYSDNEIRKAKSYNKSTLHPGMIENKQIGDFKNKSPRKSGNLQLIQNKSFSKNDSILGSKLLLQGTEEYKAFNESVRSKGPNCTVFLKDINFDKSTKPISSTIIMDDCDGNDEIKLDNIKKDNSRILDDTCEPMDVDVSIPEINVCAAKDNNCLQNIDKKNNLPEINSTEKVEPKQLSLKNISGEKAFNNTNILENTDCDNTIVFLNTSKTICEDNTKNNKTQGKQFNMNTSSNSTKNVKNSYADVEGATDNTPVRQKILTKSGVITSTPVQTNNSSKDCESRDKLVSKKLKKQNTINASLEDNSSDNEIEKNLFVDNEAIDAGDNYESGDSQDESEREYAEENEIPTKGVTLDSDEDESDDTDYEKDSFVVSSDEDDNELLSGSGDDLSISDNELKLTKKSKENYNKRKTKEQKHASREMFEARHGKSNNSLQAEDTDDSDITFVSKNKKRNRLRLDSSKDAMDSFDREETGTLDNNKNSNISNSDKDSSKSKIVDELEITVFANASKIDADPLISFTSIKKELLDVTNVNNTGLKEIENIDVDQDVTIFSNKDTKNPLQSFEDDESSQSDSSDGGIADNYNSLLNELNNSKGKQNQLKLEQNVLPIANKFKGNLSYSDYKIPKNKNDCSLMAKLNLTSSGKEIKIKPLPQTQSSSPKKGIIVNNDEIDSKSVETPKNRKHTNQISTTITDDIPAKENQSLTESNRTKPNDNSLIKVKDLKKLNTDTTIHKQLSENDSSSDAIDFKLLFAQGEDSDDAPQQLKLEDDDMFIPLKRSEAKTNLLEQSQCLGDVSENGLKPKKDYKNMKKTTIHVQSEAREETINGEKHDQIKGKSKKRKFNNDAQQITKDNLSSSEKKIKITRLPQSIIQKLDDHPQNAANQKPTIIATSHFNVETVIPRRNKPSQFLEESVYLDKSPKKSIKESKKIEKPKVLPSVPKATISNTGFTSNFKVNVLKQEKRHDAVLAGPELQIQNFKTNRLYGSSIKRIATEELCRKQKKIKTNKF